jgi:hypothetical protein
MLEGRERFDLALIVVVFLRRHKIKIGRVTRRPPACKTQQASRVRRLRCGKRGSRLREEYSVKRAKLVGRRGCEMRSASPSAWRGAAFDCCRTHHMIARKILALPNVVQQAAPGDVSTRGLPERCSIVRIKTKTLRVVAASGDVHGSRLPTHAESGKPNVPIAPVQLRTVKSGSPPGGGSSSPPICHLSFVILPLGCLP